MAAVRNFSSLGSRTPTLTYEQEQYACYLRSQAWSVERIGDALGVSTATAWRITRSVPKPKRRKVRKATLQAQ